MLKQLLLPDKVKRTKAIDAFTEEFKTEHAKEIEEQRFLIKCLIMFLIVF